MVPCALSPDHRTVPFEERVVSQSLKAAYLCKSRVGSSPNGHFGVKGGQSIAHVQSEELIEAALRMWPDRVLMQELRDGAAFTFVRSIAAGHPGSTTTYHARSAEGAFDALRLMIKQHDAGKHLCEAYIQRLITQPIDVVVHCQKLPDGTRRIAKVRLVEL